jgi:hypothetical protein
MGIALSVTDVATEHSWGATSDAILDKEMLTGAPRRGLQMNSAAGTFPASTQTIARSGN